MTTTTTEIAIREKTLNFSIDALIEEALEKNDKALELYNEYQRVGMKAMQKQATLGLVAGVLKEVGMHLVKVAKPDSDGDCRAYEVMEDGMLEVLKNHTYWKIMPLKDFPRPVPIEILKRLPTDFAEKAKALYRSRDPIIIYPIESKSPFRFFKRQIYYVGVCDWD